VVNRSELVVLASSRCFILGGTVTRQGEVDNSIANHQMVGTILDGGAESGSAPCCVPFRKIAMTRDQADGATICSRALTCQSWLNGVRR
jgi:hypothetical protein